MEFDMQNVFSVLIFFQIVVYGQFSSTVGYYMIGTRLWSFSLIVIQKVLDL